MARAARIQTDLVAKDVSLSRTLKRADKNMRNLERSANRIGKSLKNFGALLGIGFGARAIKNQLDYADAIGKTAKQLGGTTEFLSEAAAAAKLAGIETRTLTTGLQRMTRRVAEAAAGSSEFGKAFKALGIDAAKLRDLTLEQQFTQIQRALAGVNSEAERVRLAQKIFDSEGVVIARLAGEFDNLRKTAKAAGATITDDFANQAAAINDNVTKAIERLNNALRSSISLTFQLGEGLGIALARFLGFEDGAIGAFNSQIADAQKELDQLLNARDLASSGNAPNSQAFLEAIIPKIEEAEAKLKTAKAALDDFFTLQQPSKIELPAPDVKITENNISKSLDDQIETLVINPLSAEAERRARGVAGVYVDEISSHIIEPTKQAEKELSVFADQAARNMQSSFAQFLFDPFEDGLRGMVQGFIDSLRRMVAEAAAARIFEALNIGGRIAGGFGGLLTGGASTPGATVSVPGASKATGVAAGKAGVTVVNNIDARGADTSVLSQLPAILERSKQETKNEIVGLIHNRRIGLGV